MYFYVLCPYYSLHACRFLCESILLGWKFRLKFPQLFSDEHWIIENRLVIDSPAREKIKKKKRRIIWTWKRQVQFHFCHFHVRSRLSFACANELLTRGRAKNVFSYRVTFIDFKINISFNGSKYMFPSKCHRETRWRIRIIFYWYLTERNFLYSSHPPSLYKMTATVKIA